jgi:hypothetical protein
MKKSFIFILFITFFLIFIYANKITPGGGNFGGDFLDQDVNFVSPPYILDTNISKIQPLHKVVETIGEPSGVDGESFTYHTRKEFGNCRILGTWIITNFPPTPVWDPDPLPE